MQQRRVLCAAYAVHLSLFQNNLWLRESLFTIGINVLLFYVVCVLKKQKVPSSSMAYIFCLDKKFPSLRLFDSLRLLIRTKIPKPLSI